MSFTVSTGGGGATSMSSSQSVNDRSPSSENNELMTSSYHEISEVRPSPSPSDSHLKSQELPQSLEQFDQKARKLFDKARNWVGDLSLDGIVSTEGQQLTYVAQDIEERIKLASPVREEGNLRKYESISTTGSLSNSDDLNVVINEIETEAKKLASSVDTLTENLTGILHSLSSMTVDCTFVASEGVSQLCDTADASIKVMYQVMAKSEELNRAVQPLYRVHQQIKETKRLLDKVEAEVN